MSRIIIGIHGLSNKPPPADLAEYWQLALLEGLAKNTSIHLQSLPFSLVYWADVVYEHYDSGAESRYQEASPGALRRYRDHWIAHIRSQALDFFGSEIDILKEIFGIDQTAELFLKWQFQELARYYTNEPFRHTLRQRLIETLLRHQEKRILLLAHSMGSIIAYDALRELGNRETQVVVSHLITLGSPLGLPHVKYKITQEHGPIHTPSIVRRWSNLADPRDRVALDAHLRDDFEANYKGVRVIDIPVMNDWPGNFHKSYGYLRTPELSDIVKTFV